ncbi:exodeoxyribonuclease III [uncultured Mycolicibacterium sp.]|uniref:exodeoxyribonuclease III n=1 Tax=uncultured Mycolicibacterium sp. TaxID=2320817 RepID=UPI002631C9E6|nr:exodeoxyribonuclease III [uncultured Mycolicibacterium sp.]
MNALTVTTINVNGVRAAVRQRSERNRGLLAWLAETAADVVCLQETRCEADQLADALAPALADGWQLVSACSHIKGRAGVAILSRRPPTAVRVGLAEDCEFATHGRYLEAEIDGVTVASVYVHTGEAGTDRQLEKERFMAALAKRMDVLLADGGPAVICGDWNIAHTEADIKNWKANTKRAGFLPSERQWVSELLDAGWVDVMRELHPGVAGPYSWWTWRGRAFDTDAGWRIDYHLCTPPLAERAVAARVEKPAAYELRWSDHAPVTVEFR